MEVKDFTVLCKITKTNFKVIDIYLQVIDHCVKTYQEKRESS